MIEWLAIPLAVAGAAMLPKGKVNEAKVIQQIFENKKVCIKRNDVLYHPNLKRKTEGEGFTSYFFSLPYGLNSDDIEGVLPAIKDALNKEVEMEMKGLLRIDIYHKDLPENWKYDQTLLRPGTWEVPIGKNHKGILYHDFDKYPHLLTGGVTRFGKTVFLKELFNTLLLNNPQDAEFYFLDLKGGLEFYRYSGLPQVHPVACDIYEAASTLDGIVETLKEREKEFKEKGYNNIVDSPIKKRTFVIVDEGAELAPQIVTRDKVKYAQFCQSALGEIARVGGGLGYRLIFATQYPTKEAVPRQVKANIVAKLSFICSEKYGSMVILDEIGAEDLPAIPGRAIYKVEKSRTVQVPYITDKQMFSMMEGRKDDLLNAEKSGGPADNDRPPGRGKDKAPRRNPRPKKLSKRL